MPEGGWECRGGVGHISPLRCYSPVYAKDENSTPFTRGELTHHFWVTTDSGLDFSNPTQKSVRSSLWDVINGQDFMNCSPFRYAGSAVNCNLVPDSPQHRGTRGWRQLLYLGLFLCLCSPLPTTTN